MLLAAGIAVLASGDPGCSNDPRGGGTPVQLAATGTPEATRRTPPSLIVLPGARRTNLSTLRASRHSFAAAMASTAARSGALSARRATPTYVKGSVEQ